LGRNHIAKEWLPVVLVIALALVVYLPFQSASLDDFDSYNFARALVKFNPASGTPHPPGYVLYVWLGRMALALTGDARVALTSLSAVCAAVACGVLFALASALFSAQAALYAFALILFTPVMWLNANKALSDAPGLLAQALCMWFIVLAVKRRAPLWVAGLCLGVAAGFRPQGVIGLATALLLAAIRLRTKPKMWLVSGSAIIISVLTWLLPLLAALAWKVAALRVYLSGATAFVTTQESLFATVVSAQSVAARWQALWFWSSQAVFAPIAGWLRALLFAGTLFFMGIACLRRRNNIGVWLCMAWLVPQLVVHLLFLNPSLTRYLLAFLFPVAILVAVGLDSLSSKRVSVTTVVVLMVVVGSAALPLANKLHTLQSPPEQLAAYIADRFTPTQTLIVARQSYNALAYHLPGWDVRFADYFGDAVLKQEFARGQATYIVIADPEGLRPDEQYVEIETRSFARDPQIHAKHARVDVNVYSRTAGLAWRDFALPETKSILVGTPQDAKYILDGWYRREDIGGVAARWTGSDISATIRVLLPQGTMTMTIRAWSFSPNQVVELFCNDQFFASVPVPQDWTEVSAPLPVSCIQPHALTHISFRPTVLAVPANDGKSTDCRSLGIAICEIRFAP